MTMLTTFDPVLGDFDRLVNSFFGSFGRPSTWAPRWMPADVYRKGEEIVAAFDLPGVDPASVEVTVDKGVLTVKAERSWAPEEGSQVTFAERPHGKFSRQLYLSEELDPDHVSAHYENGVLTVTIPIAEYARPRKVAITTGSGDGRQAIEASSKQN
jgi:HSP20 family protein